MLTDITNSENVIKYTNYEWVVVMRSTDSINKLDTVIRLSWNLLKQKLVNDRFDLTKEAPFQFHLATIIKEVGDLHCFSRSEMFSVDLETKESKESGKPNYVDITIEFTENGEVKSRGVLELKFKRRDQGADDLARIDSYIDIQSLERLCLNDNYDRGYFLMIADNDAYTKESRAGTTGEIFSMRNGYRTPTNTNINNPNCKSRSEIVINLRNEYMFDWKEIEPWYFLKLEISNLHI